MRTKTYTVAKAGNTTVDMADDAVMKIIPKGGRFTSNVHAYQEGNALVLCYADGTAVTLANL